MARKGKAPAHKDGVEPKDAAVVTEVKENGASEESGDAEPTAAENGETAPAEAPEKKKKEKKPLKKCVPDWATLSDTARKSIPKAQMSKPKVQDLIVEALQATADHKGVASAGSIKNYITNEHPNLPKMVIKKGVLKAVEKGLLKQVKGKGFSGSFKLESSKNVAKVKAKDAKAASGSKPPLESVFPSVFTWATNPKEASVAMIKKYITKNYPDLDVDGKAFRKAIEGGESKGQLKRLTGKGFSGTFELVDGANKTGSKYEDAIENAIISMNEPKQVSVSGLRDYLSKIIIYKVI